MVTYKSAWSSRPKDNMVNDSNCGGVMVVAAMTTVTIA